MPPLDLSPFVLGYKSVSTFSISKELVLANQWGFLVILEVGQCLWRQRPSICPEVTTLSMVRGTLFLPEFPSQLGAHLFIHAAFSASREPFCGRASVFACNSCLSQAVRNLWVLSNQERIQYKQPEYNTSYACQVAVPSLIFCSGFVCEIKEETETLNVNLNSGFFLIKKILNGIQFKHTLPQRKLASIPSHHSVSSFQVVLCNLLRFFPHRPTSWQVHQGKQGGGRRPGLSTMQGSSQAAGSEEDKEGHNEGRKFSKEGTS